MTLYISIRKIFYMKRVYYHVVFLYNNVLLYIIFFLQNNASLNRNSNNGKFVSYKLLPSGVSVVVFVA